MIRFTLDTFLKTHQLTARQLADEVQASISRSRLAFLLQADRVAKIDFETLEDLLAALKRLLGWDVRLAELFDDQYVPEGLTVAGVPHTGDRVTDEILNSQPDILESLRCRKSRRRGVPVP